MGKIEERFIEVLDASKATAYKISKIKGSPKSFESKVSQIRHGIIKNLSASMLAALYEICPDVNFEYILSGVGDSFKTNIQGDNSVIADNSTVENITTGGTSSGNRSGNSHGHNIQISPSGNGHEKIIRDGDFEMTYEHLSDGITQHEFDLLKAKFDSQEQTINSLLREIESIKESFKETLSAKNELIDTLKEQLRTR